MKLDPGSWPCRNTRRDIVLIVLWGRLGIPGAKKPNSGSICQQGQHPGFVLWSWEYNLRLRNTYLHLFIFVSQRRRTTQWRKSLYLSHVSCTLQGGVCSKYRHILTFDRSPIQDTGYKEVHNGLEKGILFHKIKAAFFSQTKITESMEGSTSY